MNYAVCKIGETFKNKRAYFFILLIMFCIGISFGMYLVRYMGETDKNDLICYFNEFLKTLQGQDVNHIELLKTTIVKNLFILVPLIIGSFTFIGFPIILFINLIKGFLLGYTFSFVVCAASKNGVMLGMLSVLPQNLFYIPCIIALSIICLDMSSEKFKRKFFKDNRKIEYDKKELIYKLVVVIMLFFIGALVETFFTPFIMKVIMK